MDENLPGLSTGHSVDIVDMTSMHKPTIEHIIDQMPRDMPSQAAPLGHPSASGRSNRVEGMISEEYIPSDTASSKSSVDLEKEQNRSGEIGEEKLASGGDRNEYPSPAVLALVTVGVCLAAFLVSLDRTIVTTAIPEIANEFHSYSDVGWYGSAYLLTSSAFQASFGRVYDMFRVKWTYLISLLIFEVGSIVCATAPTSVQLIVGRAITGLGSAGMLTGSFVIAAENVPLRQRPIYIALVGTIYSLGAIAGPLLGGVFTTLVTWRWVFWISLPVGGLTLITIFFCIRSKEATNGQLPLKEKLVQLDPVSNVLALGATTMFFYALQQKNNGLSWNNATIIGLLVGAGISLILLIVWQWWRGEKALMPPSVICKRSVAAGFASAFFIYATLLAQSYYLPMWFQAIKVQLAVQSGIDMIPYIASSAVATLFAGAVVSKSGYFGPPSIVGCGIALVGSSLLCTLQVNTASANWIGYLVLTGIGLGLAVQQGFTAVQTVLPASKLAIGTAAITTAQTLGGAIFVSVGDTVLLEDLMHAQVPGVNVKALVTAGPTMFQKLAPPQLLPEIEVVYNSALRKVFIMAAALCGLAFLSSFAFEQRRSVKDDRAPGADSQNDTEKGESLGERTLRSSTDSETGSPRRIAK